MDETARKKNLLDPEEAASVLGCSPGHVVELARRGELRASKHGRVWRYCEDDLTSYRAEAGREKPSSG
jgi:excisionase family DNA binding protein